MNSYDTMSVMSLLCAYAEWATSEGDDKLIGEEMERIESALRKACISEASVGTGRFTGDYGIGMFGEYEPQEGFSVNMEGEHDPDIVYDLIPKETP